MSRSRTILGIVGLLWILALIIGRFVDLPGWLWIGLLVLGLLIWIGAKVTTPRNTLH